jgi:hypothetical protein
MKNLLCLLMLMFFIPGIGRGQFTPQTPSEVFIIEEGGKEVRYVKLVYSFGEFYFRNGVQISAKDYSKATKGHHPQKPVRDTTSRHGNVTRPARNLLNRHLDLFLRDPPIRIIHVKNPSLGARLVSCRHRKIFFEMIAITRPDINSCNQPAGIRAIVSNFGI